MQKITYDRLPVITQEIVYEEDWEIFSTEQQKELLLTNREECLETASELTNLILECEK